MTSIIKANGRLLKLFTNVRHGLVCRKLSDKNVAGWELRRLKRCEVQQVLKYSNREGRNHTLAYLQSCFDLFPRGWWGVVEDGKLLGSFAMYDFEDNSTVMSGFLLVNKSKRDLGIGKILNEFNTSLGKGKNAFVMSVNPNYMYKQCFKPTQQTETSELTKTSMDFKSMTDPTVKIVSLNQDMIPKVEQYDARIHPIPRINFFHKVILGCAHLIFVALDKTDNVIGYATLRKANDGWRFAPIYAESDDVGRQLFMTLLNQVEDGELITTTTFTENRSAVTLQKDLGFEPVSSSTLMFTQSPPDIPNEKVFALAGKEFSLC